jgi:hypothetical protein
VNLTIKTLLEDYYVEKIKVVSSAIYSAKFLETTFLDRNF